MTTTTYSPATTDAIATFLKADDACTARAGVFAHGTRNRAIDALWDTLVEWDDLTALATQQDVIDVAKGRTTVAQVNAMRR